MAKYNQNNSNMNNCTASRCGNFVQLEKLVSWENKPLTSLVFAGIAAAGKGMPVIYSFTRDNKEYIGQTTNLQTRIWEHRSSPWSKSPKKLKSCTKLYGAVRKYGWEAFTFRVIRFGPEYTQGASVQWLKDVETKILSDRKPYYNVIQANEKWQGSGVMLNYDHLKEKRKPWSEEQKEKMSKTHTAQFGIPVKVLNVDTGVVNQYPSKTAVLKEFPMWNLTLNKYLDSGEIYTSPQTGIRLKFFYVSK